MDTRAARLAEIRGSAWDVLVIGGGASGLGAAVEAAARGYRTLLVERDDFSKGTSSRSTKLAHGGVRYLEQLNIHLVRDALKERGYMLRNAPHLVHKLGFVIPIYHFAALPYYGVGLKIYERLSGELSLGKSVLLSVAETVARLPTVRREGLKGGVYYLDGQFDDSRYAIALMRTLEDLGGAAVNYTEVTGLLHRYGRVEGVRVRERETGDEFDVLARSVVNATGVLTEQILRMDTPQTAPLLSLSQGTHFVLPREFLPSGDGMMIPKTNDGRVLFAIPWHERLVVGTTDEPVEASEGEPRALGKETKFLSDHIRKYLGRSVGAGDVLSVWSGLRPLLRAGGGSTSKLARDHRVLVSKSGLVTVTGGKWTTYRKMGEDTINGAASFTSLKAAASRTADLRLHGWVEEGSLVGVSDSERVYGADLGALQELGESAPALNELLHPALPYKKREVVWAVRQEQARTVEDVLARRTRALFLDARAALEAAGEVSRMLAEELGRSAEFAERDLEEFRVVASGYIYQG